jgi:hypothetical protein
MVQAQPQQSIMPTVQGEQTGPVMVEYRASSSAAGSVLTPYDLSPLHVSVVTAACAAAVRSHA